MATNANEPMGKYLPINDIELYYEVHGTGKPLIMLHGGFGSFDMFSSISPTLAQDHQVIGVDLYGHGHTAITDRPIDFEQMADDIAGLIHHLGLEKVDILGYSLGGNVALQTAIRYPELISRLIVISIPFKRSGWYPEVQAGMTVIDPELLKQSEFFYGYYKRVSPRPEKFIEFGTKMREAISRDYDWTESVSSLKIPTLIIVGDSDSMPPSHAAEFFALLGGGTKDAGWNNENVISSQLAIVPGATHYNILSKDELLLSVITSFLR
jgi:pimeloyl-ACP methyl ester carboxylesterase